MENKIYNDDVERIVNDPERQEAINERYYNRQMHKQKKRLADGCVYATFTVAFGLLGYVGWMASWLAFPIFAGCGLYAAFCFGRYFENGKIWGWM
jgi:uncharacterized membrane protein (DUF485 family)